MPLAPVYSALVVVAVRQHPFAPLHEAAALEQATGRASRRMLQCPCKQPPTRARAAPHRLVPLLPLLAPGSFYSYQA
jgi:hypothetical protein